MRTSWPTSSSLRASTLAQAQISLPSLSYSTMPSRMQVVETAAMSCGLTPVCSMTPRMQLLASAQLCVQSKSMLPGKRGSSACVHSCWTQPSCSPSRLKSTARTLPVPASTAMRVFAIGTILSEYIRLCMSIEKDAQPSFRSRLAVGSSVMRISR